MIEKPDSRQVKGNFGVALVPYKKPLRWAALSPIENRQLFENDPALDGFV
jgi:hypothetical protein